MQERQKRKLRQLYFLFQLNLTDLKEQELDNGLGDISNYQPNGEFELRGFEWARHVVNYSCCPEPYGDITYYIILKRRPMFYVFNLILPCILINGIGQCHSRYCRAEAANSSVRFAG